MSDFSFLNNPGKEFLGTQRNIIVLKPNIIMLPQKQLNGYKISLINESGRNITINNNSKTDLIYSRFYAPNGSKEIIVEPNTKIDLIYINYKYNKIGKWYLSMN